MARTLQTTSDPKTVKRWAGEAFVSTMGESFFQQTMMGKGESDTNAPIHVRNDLSQQAGDEITYTVYAQLTGQPVFGDDNLEGNAAKLDGYVDKVTINAIKKPVDVGGTMTRKRNPDDLRMIAKDKGKDYMARFFDEACHMTLAGRRGINPEFILPTTVTSAVQGTQAFTDYDANHIVYGGAAVSKGTLVSTDKFSLDAIDKAVTMAQTEGGGSDGKMRISPLSMGGEDKFVLLMHPWQEHDLRIGAGNSRWVDIQKAATTNMGERSKIFKNSMGEYRGVVLRSHSKVIRSNDYGTGSNVNAARAVLMGRQALVVAFGDAGQGQRASWVEKLTDLDDSKPVITFGLVAGFKRPQFNSQDISSIAIDTAVAKPY